METIDCRNMACPAPVITVKKAFEQHGAVQVLLDDGAPRENVTRFARNRGLQVAEERQEGAWLLTISSGSMGQGAVKQHQIIGKVVLITSDRFGDGPEELGRLLMRNFIHTLLETPDLPGRILFLNTGIFLAVAGSDVLEALIKLQGMGVEICSCGLCLDYFNQRDHLRVGSVTNMFATAEGLLEAEQVIRL